MSRVRTALLQVLMGAVMMAACADADESGDPGPATPAAPTAPASVSTKRWLAVVEVAPLADDLNATTERLRDPLGLALVVSPVDCFDGLPADLETGYLIGAVGDSADEVEQLIADAGEQTMFSVPVTIVCTD
ncbi:MAG: hypothetical protein WEE66_12850 [Actinomycetota bacterium]